jgi:hypothetical protein
MRNYKDDHLGKPKNLAQTYIPEGVSFGSRKNVGDPWNAGMCIRGAANMKEVEPDVDL